MYTPGQYPPLGGTLDLIFQDFQKQITANLASQTAGLAADQTQIKQVTLTLEGELNTLEAAFDTLKAYVRANIPS